MEETKPSLYWTDSLARELVAKFGTGHKFIVNDAKTPSGVIHVGSLRGVIIHDAIRRSFTDSGAQAEFTYEFDDMDAFDRMVVYLPADFESHLGKPLCKMPSPEPGFSNFAECYAKKFAALFPLLGCAARIEYMSDIYKSGRLDKSIKVALDNSAKINEINERISGAKKKDQLPFQPICENCGKIGSTFAYEWNGKTVKYRCLPSMVDWAKGCGYEGQVSPFGGTGKLPWKAEWAGRWPVIGVNVELAGKDHYTKTGSRAVSDVLSDEVFGYPHPYGFGYEFFLVGGKKMSTSKGRGVTAEEAARLIPPVLLRFLLIKTRPRAQLDFDPSGYTLIRLFDEYDLYERAYFGKEEVGTDVDNFRRIYQLSQVGEIPGEFPEQLPFSHAVTLVQIFQDDEKAIGKIGKDSPQIRERLAFARNWVAGGYCPKELEIKFQGEIPEAALSLSEKQKEALAELSKFIGASEEKLSEEIRMIPQRIGGITPREFFEGAYLAILGAPKGPKLAPFLSLLDPEKVRKRLLLKG